MAQSSTPRAVRVAMWGLWTAPMVGVVAIGVIQAAVGDFPRLTSDWPRLMSSTAKEVSTSRPQQPDRPAAFAAPDGKTYECVLAK